MTPRGSDVNPAMQRTNTDLRFEAARVDEPAQEAQTRLLLDAEEVIGWLVGRAQGDQGLPLPIAECGCKA